jgi:lipid-binding SYLF domain-containing protein
MMDITRRTLSIATLSATALALAKISKAQAETATELSEQSYAALKTLFADVPNTRNIALKAKGILVFPRIVKAGIGIGGMSGDGTLFVGMHTHAHYNISGGSIGLQLGAQTYSYALFFMNETSLSYLENSSGWSIGSGPSVVAMDKSAATAWTAAGAQSGDVYAIPFSASGLMASLSLEGTKITRIFPG